MSCQAIEDELLKTTLKLDCDNNNTLHTSHPEISEILISDNNDNCVQLSKKQENDNRNNHQEVKYLEIPTQSRNDLKKYRVIQLKNGLKALLISDIYNQSNADGSANVKCVEFLRNEIYKCMTSITTLLSTLNRDNNKCLEEKCSNIAINKGVVFDNEDNDVKKISRIKSIYASFLPKWRKCDKLMKTFLTMREVNIKQTTSYEKKISSDIEENKDNAFCHDNDKMKKLGVESSLKRDEKMAPYASPISETEHHCNGDSVDKEEFIFSRYREIQKCVMIFKKLFISYRKNSNILNDRSFKDEESKDTPYNEDDNDDGTELESSEKGEKMAACALCINVGNFSDPPEIEGLAHFLEHMIFMGSKKYPKEDDFDMFISKYGGSTNAFTSAEHTAFQFEIIKEHLFPAIDRFAQFFIAPLMLRDAIVREQKVIESEFQMETSDLRRQDQILGSLAQPYHPVSKFACGNLMTLQENITEDKLYEELHQFFERHYSAHRMTLAIQAQLPLDILEDYVKKCFSSIPSNYLPADDFAIYKDPKSFNTHSFRRLYKIKPNRDMCKVELTWVMPSLRHLYRAKPHQYVAWLINADAPGSLIRYLRKKMWCLNIRCGNSKCDFENNSIYTLFTLSLMLTKEGYAHLKEVLDAVFSFIKIIRNFGQEENLYKILRNGRDINFRFINEKLPINYVTHLCRNMHLYAPIDYITGSCLYFEYDSVSIKNCMDNLYPENVNIIISNKQFDEKTLDKSETWYKTKYSDEEIPKEWIDEWRDVKPFPEFYLLEPKLHLIKYVPFFPIYDSCKYPRKIYQDNLYELWYKPNVKFEFSKSYMKFRIISPLFTLSPKEQAMGDVMVGILKHVLADELLPVNLSNSNYKICSYEHGLIIEMSAFNNKLPLLFGMTITYMAKCAKLVTEDLFMLMKLELLKHYNNQMMKPSKLNDSIWLSMLILSSWNKIDNYNALRNVSFDEFKVFLTSYTKHIYIQGLIQGNVSEEVVIKKVLNTFKTLNCGPLLANTLPQSRIISLPIGTYRCQLKNFNPADSNSIITNYYQSDKWSLTLFVILELFLKIMEIPLFNELRTQQQLGYGVFCSLVDMHAVLGFSITVCTQADKFSTDDVDSRIEKFLESFNSKLNVISDEEFETVKKSLIKVKQCVDVNLKKEVNRNWCEIFSGAYMFDRLKQQIKELERININHIRNWFKAHMLGGSNCKKLSIHIIGSKTKNNEQFDCESSHCISAKDNDKMILKFIDNLANNDCNSMLNYDGYITDIKKFKDNLYAYPVHCTNTQYNFEQYK